MERFAFYGMRALLVRITVPRLRALTRSRSRDLHRTVYLTPILGGYRRPLSHYVGDSSAASSCEGPLRDGVSGAAVSRTWPAQYRNGFFKPNISTLLGTLYREHDPRRDGGFTIFYIGINLGALLSPLIAGTLGEKIGWHWGFASAGVGMLFGLTQFVLSQHKLGTAGLPAGKEKLDTRDWLRCSPSVRLWSVVYAVRGAWQMIAPVWNGIATELKIGIALAIFHRLSLAAEGDLHARRMAPRARDCDHGCIRDFFGWVSSRRAEP